MPSVPPKPFQFLADARAPLAARELTEHARRAEAVGFHAMVVPDHLIDQLSPVPAMAVVAAATKRLRVSAFVLNNDLRHPAVLAQDLASLDVLSEGRLDVAIGAGWNVPEYEAIGLPFEPGGIRVDRLEEAVAVLKGCFGDGQFSYHGRHYTITDHDARPKPVQRPHPPFLIGGGGPRILRFAGREAQVVGLAPTTADRGPGAPPRFSLAATRQQLAWVREGAGARFDDLVLNVYPSSYPITLADHPRAEARRAADALRQRGVELSEDDVLESPHLFIGSVDSLVDKFERLRAELGVSSFMVGEMDELLPVVERLAGR
jgi:probable F420-dependent oxidoreductase